MKLLSLMLFVFMLSACGVPDSGEETRIDGILDSEHRIFVTSQAFTGNLGGIDGADSKCKQAAIDAGLVRNYSAIISNSTSSALDRLVITGPVYIFNGASEGVKLTDNGLDLWSTETTNLLSSVNFDENGTSISATPWSGTTASGGSGTDFCDGWTSEESSQDGDVGSTSFSTSQWIENNFQACNLQNSLYCISQ